jgi:hypothetical protein
MIDTETGVQTATGDEVAVVSAAFVIGKRDA